MLTQFRGGLLNTQARGIYRFDLIVFDLDGTLIDSKLDLANSVNFTRIQMGLSQLDNSLIYDYIGDGAITLVRRAMGEGLDETQVQRALEIFLEHYRGHLLDNTVLYQGVKETIEKLSSVTLAVLTNKPVNLTHSILAGLGLHGRFAWVHGGDSFRHKKPNPIGLKAILHSTQIPPERTLMVGDSYIDIQTGQQAGVFTCGVSYGLGGKALGNSLPDYLIDRFDQLPEIAGKL